MKTRHALAASLALSLLLCAADARAQDVDEAERGDAEAPRIEVGAHVTSLTLPRPDFFGTDNQAGFGGRFTYNFSRHFAAEGELNVLPTVLFPGTAAGGRTLQGQFGVKLGKRFRRFGVFAKARPGFVRFGDVLRVTRTQVSFFGRLRDFNLFSFVGRTYFSADVGGVIELYPSRRVVVRFDAGDTMIRYDSRIRTIDGPIDLEPRDFRPVVREAAEFEHNFQFSAGVAFRFRGGDETDANDARSSSERAPRFEVGAQFSSLNFSGPDKSSLTFVFDDTSANAEAGVGARFTVNLSDSLAVEAEGNFYPRTGFTDEAATWGGFPSQLQAGVKAGRRFRKFGLFAKARPGFVHFSRVRQLVGTRTESFTFDGRTFTFVYGVYDERSKTYFSTDVGGVVEFYPSRRVVTRFDFGDTVIRYDRRPVETFDLRRPFIEVRAETKHNLQFTAGVAFRF